MSSNTIADNFLAYASTRLHQSQKTIAACLDKLTDDQQLHRNGDHENSIVNLLLHLEGNLRQWILHGIDNQPDIRQRDEEFTLTLSPRRGNRERYRLLPCPQMFQTQRQILPKRRNP